VKYTTCTSNYFWYLSHSSVTLDINICTAQLWSITAIDKIVVILLWNAHIIIKLTVYTDILLTSISHTRRPTQTVHHYCCRLTFTLKSIVLMYITVYYYTLPLGHRFPDARDSQSFIIPKFSGMTRLAIPPKGKCKTPHVSVSERVL